MSPKRLMNGSGGKGAVIVVCAISNRGHSKSNLHSSNLAHMFFMSLFNNKNLCIRCLRFSIFNSLCMLVNYNFWTC